MLEPTKKRPTEIEISFRGPEHKRQEAITALEGMGFVVQDAAPIWRSAFPDLQENEPGTYLAGARHREGLTQRQLANAKHAATEAVATPEQVRTGMLNKLRAFFALG